MVLTYMSFIANDLSITFGFDNHQELVKAFDDLIKILISNQKYRSSFYITNTFSYNKVDEENTVRDVILKLNKSNTKSLILSWLDKSRLFWNDSRVANQDDYFEFNKMDVTNQGIGECSRRSLIKIPIFSFSFGSNFCENKLHVQHGLAEDILNIIELDNIWRLEDFKETVQKSRGEPKSWNDVITFAKDDFKSLRFSEKLIEQISIQPFHLGIARRFFDLSKALEEIITSRDAQKNFTDKTIELVTKYFHGDKAWFTDETENDKRDFKNELKFYPPSSDSLKSYSFHGKIKIEQIRIYIEWPLKPEHEFIDIVYFGPKITKK